jgi:MFS family permease
VASGTAVSGGALPADQAALRRARVSALAYFAMLGLVDGVWLARIPAVKHNLNLSDGVLGVALLAAPAGTVLITLVAGRLVDRFGSAWAIPLAGVATSLLPVALGLARSLAELMAALFAFGVTAGTLDISINAQAVRVERGYRRPLLTSFHACYSLGGLTGALLGGLFAWAGVGPAPTFTAVGVPMAVLAAIASRGLLRGPEFQGGPEPTAAHRTADSSEAGTASRSAADRVDGARQSAADRADAAGLAAASRRGLQARPGSEPDNKAAWMRIIVLGLLALCCLLSEGAAGSWSAVYLRDNLGTSAGFAALGYAAFSVMMAAGRMCGDRLVARFGQSRLVRACGVVAAVGLAAGLISGDPAGALIGFALFGAGLSITFPQLLSAGGNVAAARSGRGIAGVAGIGYLGLLGGPVAIGSFASLVGLRLALAVPVALMLFVALGGGAAARRSPG